MASATRSGRAYACVEPVSGNVVVTSPARKRSRKNIVTPEKAEPASQAVTPIKHAALSVEECEVEKDFTLADAFEYDASCEELSPGGPALPSSASAFMYNTPSDTESDISAGFGGWLTNERVSDTAENNKENHPPPECLTSSLLIELQRRSSAETTIPRFPLLPRNDYGGIRDCLPPEQLTRWSGTKTAGSCTGSTTAKTPATVPAAAREPPTEASTDEPAVLHKTFTAEQLLRMERNRHDALEKLRVKNGK